MRVMLLGAGGLVGKAMLSTVPRGIVVHPYLRGQLDITDTSRATASIMELKPDLILNAAGYTAVDRAESEPDLAFRINAEAVGHLGKISAAHGFRVMHFSTDYVFSGKSRDPYPEDAAAEPVNVYGASKLAGEVALRESGARAVIIRTQWLFGSQGHSFVRAMWERARKRNPTRVVADQFGRPTYVQDLARAAWKIIGSGLEGTFHVANRGIASWFDLAQAIFSRAGCPDLLVRCTSQEYFMPALRPAFSALCTSRAEALLGPSFLRPWQEALTEMFDESPSPLWQDAPAR